MAGSYGVSFLPGSQDDGKNMRGERTGVNQSPVQEAVKILSLRLPKFYGSQGLAPSLLLNSPGGMGQPGAKGGSATAQALAQMAGLPPSMGLPQSLVPTLGSGGGGTDTYNGWAQHEKEMNQPVPAPGAPLPPRIIPGDVERPSGPPAQDFTTAPAPTGGGLAPPLSPEYQAYTLANPESPNAWAPESYQSPLAPPPASPWERPGRNPNLAEKYLELLDQFGGMNY